MLFIKICFNALILLNKFASSLVFLNILTDNVACLNELHHDKSNNLAFRPNLDSDQPGYLSSLIKSTVKFLNFRKPENFVIICLKLQNPVFCQKDEME